MGERPKNRQVEETGSINPEYQQNITELFEKYKKYLLTFITNLLRRGSVKISNPEDEAQDILNSVFESLVRGEKIDFGRMDSIQIKDYLFTTAKRRAIDYVRQNYKDSRYDTNDFKLSNFEQLDNQGEEELQEKLIDPRNPSEEKILKTIGIEKIIDTPGMFSEEDKQIIKLRFIHDYEMEEIAEKLKLPNKVYVFRALQIIKRKLKAALKKYDE